LNRVIFALVAGLSLAAPAARGADAGPTGVWLDQSGRGGIDIEPCGTKLCGKLVWLKVPLNEQGKPKTDIHNPDTALQQRPLCGVPVLDGFVADGPNAWTGGTIYDAASGKTYTSNIALNPDGTLHVRGYVGLPIFGKSQTWTRPAGDLARCK
jgi:uncharacterized protein (DUF2147 family)